ncbi:VOC family protein [Mycobacterium sp. 1164985.4]|uniref:VOC family protein n=1 Tax=Mycobacterium sp. 1164985.4 TaxID=1834069 RepID=UPI0009EDA6E4|nr:VOC family protein [Mycobacterium sp. 1164985.4]
MDVEELGEDARRLALLLDELELHIAAVAQRQRLGDLTRLAAIARGQRQIPHDKPGPHPQLELIQQQSEAPSVFTEFLDIHGEGFHQFAYWATDFDATMRAVAEAGWPVVWSGGEDVGTRFAYVEPPAGRAQVAQIIEIMELTDITSGMASFVRDAAANWDGSDPIRALGG